MNPNFSIARVSVVGGKRLRLTAKRRKSAKETVRPIKTREL
jgi:hypothetical protein